MLAAEAQWLRASIGMLARGQFPTLQIPNSRKFKLASSAIGQGTQVLITTPTRRLKNMAVTQQAQLSQISKSLSLKSRPPSYCRTGSRAGGCCRQSQPVVTLRIGQQHSQLCDRAANAEAGCMHSCSMQAAARRAARCQELDACCVPKQMENWQGLEPASSCVCRCTCQSHIVTPRHRIRLDSISELGSWLDGPQGN